MSRHSPSEVRGLRMAGAGEAEAVLKGAGGEVISCCALRQDGARCDSGGNSGGGAAKETAVDEAAASDPIHTTDGGAACHHTATPSTQPQLPMSLPVQSQPWRRRRWCLAVRQAVALTRKNLLMRSAPTCHLRVHNPISHRAVPATTISRKGYSQR